MKHAQINWDKLFDIGVDFGLKLLSAIIVFSIGWWLIKRFLKVISKIMERRMVDITVRPFLLSIFKIAFRILLILVVAGMLGIKVTSFIAIIGAAGLAIGMSLQGSLSNFAGGVILLILKPFKVGEYISYDGISGTVINVQIFYTHLLSDTNQEIIIPNGQIANTRITNYSRSAIRGLVMQFRIGYQNDIQLAKKLLEEIITSEKSLVANPSHKIFIDQLGDNFVSFKIQAWFEIDQYWTVNRALPEKVKTRFEENGIQLQISNLNTIQNK